MRLQQDTRGYSLRFWQPTHRPYEHNMNRIAKDIRDRPEIDAWISFDADNPPLNNPLDLLALDLDLVGCPTPVWHFRPDQDMGQRPIYYNAYRKVDDGYQEWPHHEGLQQVDAIGSGCFVVQRRVIDAIPDGPFNRHWSAEGIVTLGTDIAFSERVREAGFDVWAHYGYPCRHFVELDLIEVGQAINGLMAHG